MKRAKKGKDNSLIGFDPLVWMKESSAECGVWSVEEEAETADVDTPHSALRTPDAPSAVQLGELLTIEQVAAMHAEFGRHLHADSVVLEAGALARVDAAGLQLLAAFVRTARARGVRVEWRSPTPALREATRRLGLGPALRLP